MPVPRIILAPKNGARIAARNPDAVVVDYDEVRLRRGQISVQVTGRGKIGLTFRTAALICSCAGKVLQNAAIIEALWGDDAEGGPIAPINNFHQHEYRARYALAAVGLMVVNRYGRFEVLAVEDQPQVLAA